MSLVNNSIMGEPSKPFLLTLLDESPSALSWELHLMDDLFPSHGCNFCLQYESAWADAESKFLDANFLVL